jgi:hypothetical protein
MPKVILVDDESPPMTREDFANVLRVLRRALTEALAALGPGLSEREEARLRVIRAMEFRGAVPSREVFQIFRKAGLDPRTIGSMVRFGWLKHDGNSYELTAEALAWAQEREATHPQAADQEEVP